jgi:hypothetical protein
MPIFGLLAALLAIYVAYAAIIGEVWVHQGPFARRVVRAENPVRFWVSMTIYAGLALAMATIF